MRRNWQGPVIVWAALALATWALAALAPDRSWVLDWPRGWDLGLAGGIDRAMDWLVREASLGVFTLQQATRALAALIDAPYQAARAVLGPTGLGWVAIAGLASVAGYRAGGWPLGLLAGGGAVLLAAFGQWDSAMVTLASILVAVPFGPCGGADPGAVGLPFAPVCGRDHAHPRCDADHAVFAYWCRC